MNDGPQAQLVHLAEKAACKAGVPGAVVVFEKGSVQVHVGEKGLLMVGDSRDTYHDSGVTAGAKASGPGAQADSRGDIHQTLNGAEAAELADCLEHLKSLIHELALPDRGPLEEAQTSLDEVIEAARSPSPTAQEAKGPWQKAKACIDRAVYVGSIGAELAEKIRALYDQIHRLLS